jgi:hypothetical protein
MVHTTLMPPCPCKQHRTATSPCPHCKPCCGPAAADEEVGPGVSGRTGAGGESDADQPRKRKSVRFEDYDDQAFEDLMKMQEVGAGAGSLQNPPPAQGGRAVGLGKRPR